jgi:hypothetical protein
MTHNYREPFDYSVSCDDFLLYELARLIEEDRASFDDEEFCRVIAEGIHEHIERRLNIRAEMANRLRSGVEKPGRVLHAIEDIESPLRGITEIIHSYTAYLFRRLEECSESAPDERVTETADLLLEAPGDRFMAEPALDVLGSIRSPVSARVLAHAISEPLLEEDLELKAYNYLRAMWPLPRHFILYSLKPHTHEDIPFRWFQLLVECDEPSAVDRILEEVLTHGNDPDYHEDLVALTELLERARDPDTEDKVLQVINSPETSRAAVKLLEGFLINRKAQKPKETEGPWATLDRVYASNRKYLAAARLFDAGKSAEAGSALDELLKEDPQYPLALMLRSRCKI